MYNRCFTVNNLSGKVIVAGIFRLFCKQTISRKRALDFNLTLN